MLTVRQMAARGLIKHNVLHVYSFPIPGPLARISHSLPRFQLSLHTQCTVVPHPLGFLCLLTTSKTTILHFVGVVIKLHGCLDGEASGLRETVILAVPFFLLWFTAGTDTFSVGITLEPCLDESRSLRRSSQRRRRSAARTRPL